MKARRMETQRGFTFSTKSKPTAGKIKLTRQDHKAIGNSIYVDTDWTDFLEEHRNVLIGILDCLDVEDLVTSAFYVCKNWQDVIMEDYSERIKRRYELENELLFVNQFLFDAQTTDIMKDDETSNQMDTCEQEVPKNVKKRVNFSLEHEGTEIIPSSLQYDRNDKRRFLFSSKDVVERYVLFVRYTSLQRAREGLIRYINELLDEYTPLTNSDAKNFRHFIGWNDMRNDERIYFHQSLLIQAQRWCKLDTQPLTHKILELFDLSKDCLTYSGQFANLDIEIHLGKKKSTHVVFDEVIQLRDDAMELMGDHYSSVSFVVDRFSRPYTTNQQSNNTMED